MVLETQRVWADRWLRPMAEGAGKVGLTPNGLTLASLGLAIVAGFLFWLGQVREPWLLALGGLVVLISSVLDALDGRLARLQGSAGPRGDYLDHVTDRYADLAMLLGIGLGPAIDLRITLFAIVGTLLTSYMGTQAQAVGVGRDYRGIMGRADRLVLLGVIPIVQVLLPPALPLPFGLPPLAWLLLLIGTLGNFTALQRFAAGWKELNRREPGA